MKALMEVKGWTPPTEENSKTFSKLILRALEAEAACGAYREALKNVMRSPPSKGWKIASNALFKENLKQRGKQMLKVVKAATFVGYWMRRGTDDHFARALELLEKALDQYDMTGATYAKWYKEAGAIDPR